MRGSMNRLVSGLARVGPLGRPAGVRAQGPPRPRSARIEEARQHFERGVALLGEEKWEQALAEFQRSRELHAGRPATKNAAQCLRKLHRFDEAMEAFETLLRDFPALPPD